MKRLGKKYYSNFSVLYVKIGEPTNKILFFKCPECGQTVVDGMIDMVFELQDTHVTIRNVPAKVCSNCGHEFVDGYVAEHVNRLVDRVVEDVNSYTKKMAHPSVVPR